ESDCLDGIDNNGDGLKDCEDSTCTTVACVPAAGAGNELGLFHTAALPANDFTVASAPHQTLHSSCGGCSFSVKATLPKVLPLFPEPAQSPSPCSDPHTPGLYLTGPPDSGRGGCGPPAPINAVGVRTNMSTNPLEPCVSGGAAADQSTGGVTKTFCGAARQSN